MFPGAWVYEQVAYYAYADTRELGCETVPLSTPGALERLRELAAEDEYDNVREAAQTRLEEF